MTEFVQHATRNLFHGIEVCKHLRMNYNNSGLLFKGVSHPGSEERQRTLLFSEVRLQSGIAGQNCGIDLVFEGQIRGLILGRNRMRRDIERYPMSEGVPIAFEMGEPVFS